VARRFEGRRSKLVASVVVLALVGVGTFASFSATSQNQGNRISSGTVSISDNDSGEALLSLSSARPGATDSGCIKVTYTGSVASSVRLYGTTAGGGLDQYVDLKVTRGSFSPTEPGYDSCTDFQPDSTDYIGQGAGVIHDGTLQGYPDSYAAGVVDPPSGGAESWTGGESHVYRFEVTLRDDAAAQGLDATQTLIWEARNL
jgi:predicted ribosomally synthesized peptide with SipW-like signal peptide